MTKQSTIIVRGIFHDIYFWGKGFKDTETSLAWKKAVDEVKGIHWSVHTEKHGYGNVNYLVSTNGSIYLHPMDFTTVLHSCGVHTDDSFDCSELEEICKGIAEKCGGTFELYVSKPTEVQAELLPYEKGIHNTLSR